MPKPIPEGFHSVTPSLMFKSCQKALEFYKKAFGATDIETFPTLDGKGIMHATMRIGNSILMMGDEFSDPKSCPSAETLGNSPVSLFIYVDDVDGMFKKVVAAGGKVIMPVEEMFWGDRSGTIQDPFGYQWMIATHTRDLTKDQIRKEAETFFAEMAKK